MRISFQHKLCNQSLPQEVIIFGVVRKNPSFLFYVVPQEADHNYLFLQEALAKKYIGFYIDSKKIVACVIESVNSSERN